IVLHTTAVRQYILTHAEPGAPYRIPRPRRIPDQERAAASAPALRREQRRRAVVARRRRRHADEVDAARAVEREQPRALLVRAHDVVVRKLVAVDRKSTRLNSSHVKTSY